MRSIKISILLLGLLLGSAVAPQISFAGKPDQVKTHDMVQLNRVLKKSIDPPAFALDNREEGANVDVIFSLTHDGRIRILKLTAPSARLERYVRDELSGVTADDLVNPQDLRYQVDIRFFND
jgi:hypothetical protein